MTGYQDYLIVLSPPDSVCRRIKRLNEDSAAIVGDFDSRHAKAHITVQQWPRKKPLWIDSLMPKLERELLSLPPLTCNINGFDFFNHSETATIYASVEQDAATIAWFKHLKRFFSGGSFVPHITVARGLSPAAFKKLWPYISRQEWQESIRIDKLTILRREMIAHDASFKIYKEIPFNRRLDIKTFAKNKQSAVDKAGKPSNVIQFSLF
ncbi:MAG TPA: 2'-5' RNA ligase family protein [Mucilaginibacter sp.]|nr:2'-5' RNA ligase family protein [Mucilaginibacter sp.]